mmetsp:Transcript_32636/g.98176  ORF Transcript_32636/g.98176 Transcript_32636/m.98176 type:complete len:328 (+) Transcript_32636:1250-2233(+)
MSRNGARTAERRVVVRRYFRERGAQGGCVRDVSFFEFLRAFAALELEDRAEPLSRGRRRSRSSSSSREDSTDRLVKKAARGAYDPPPGARRPYGKSARRSRSRRGSRSSSSSGSDRGSRRRRRSRTPPKRTRFRKRDSVEARKKGEARYGDRAEIGPGFLPLLLEDVASSPTPQKRSKTVFGESSVGGDAGLSAKDVDPHSSSFQVFRMVRPRDDHARPAGRLVRPRLRRRFGRKSGRRVAAAVRRLRVGRRPAREEARPQAGDAGRGAVPRTVQMVPGRGKTRARRRDVRYRLRRRRARAPRRRKARATARRRARRLQEEETQGRR